MTTLAAGASASLILQAGVSLIVEASAGAVGTIEFNRASEDPEQSFISKVRSRGYGPFSVPVQVTIEIEAGSVEYIYSESPVSLAAKRHDVRGMPTRCEFEFIPGSVSGTTAAANMSRHAGYILEGVRYSAYKLRVWNDHSADVTYKVSALTTSDIGDSLRNADAWVQGLFSGSTDGLVPADSYLDTDVDYAHPSAAFGNGTIQWLRSSCAGGNSTRIFTPGATSSAMTLTNGFVAANQTGVDIVTTPTSLTVPVYPAHLPPVSLIGYTEKQVRRITLFSGASQLRGKNDQISLGWGFRMQRALATDDSCVIFSNYGQDTQTSLEGVDALIDALDNGGLVCDDLIWPISITDDNGLAIWATSAYVSYTRGIALRVIDECRKRGIRPILASIPILKDTVSPEYAVRVSTFDVAQDLADAGLCRYFNMFDLMQDRTQLTAQWWSPTYTVDNLHPEGAGVDLLEDYGIEFFSTT